MKLDQICVYANTEIDVDNAKADLNLSLADWVVDEVEGDVRVMDRSGYWHYGVSRGVLRFNYDLGIEFELLTYKDGMNWHNLNNRMWAPVMFGHCGYHLEKGEPWPEHLEHMLIQEMTTYRHTNPEVIRKDRTYNYRIYDTVPTLGHYTKVIRRLGPDQV